MLAPGGMRGRIASGTILLLALLGMFAALGVFDVNDSRIAPEVAVFFSVLTAYIVPVFGYITELTRDAIGDLTPTLRAPDDAERLTEAIETRRLTSQIAAALLGFGAGCAHLTLLSGSLSAAVLSAFQSRASAALVLGTLTVWIVVTSVVIYLVGNARLMLRLGRRVDIDLLQPRAYTPFARVAVSSTLALIGAQAAFPIMWINPDVSAVATIPGLIATTAAMLALFALPLIGIHRPIAAAKRSTIAALDRKIKDTANAADDASRLALLGPLLTYRREIQSVPEWPFDTSVAGRLALYLFIPPLTWVGGALIEMMLERMV